MILMFPQPEFHFFQPILTSVRGQWAGIFLGVTNTMSSDSKKYYATHKFLWNKYNDTRRFGGLRKQILKRDKNSCIKCGMTDRTHKAKWNRGITLDHIDGNGRNAQIKNNKLENLQTLCLRCHGKKDARNHWIEFNGERHILTEWAIRIGINYQTILWRLRDGWLVKEALTTPIRQYARR